MTSYRSLRGRTLGSARDTVRPLCASLQAAARGPLLTPRPVALRACAPDQLLLGRLAESRVGLLLPALVGDGSDLRVGRPRRPRPGPSHPSPCPGSRVRDVGVGALHGRWCVALAGHAARVAVGSELSLSGGDSILYANAEYTGPRLQFRCYRVNGVRWLPSAHERLTETERRAVDRACARRTAHFNKRLHQSRDAPASSGPPGLWRRCRYRPEVGPHLRDAPATVRRGEDFVIALTYGVESDWVEDVQAAGGCDLITRRGRHRLCDPVSSTTKSPARRARRHVRSCACSASSLPPPATRCLRQAASRPARWRRSAGGCGAARRPCVAPRTRRVSWDRLRRGCEASPASGSPQPARPPLDTSR